MKAQTWDGDSNSYWDSAVNWDNDLRPSPATTVTINNAGLANQPNVNIDETVTQTNVSAGNLTVTATLTSALAASGTGAVDILSGGGVTGNITTAGTSVVSNSGTVTGTITVNGGIFNNAGSVSGATTVAGGTLNLNSGTALSNSSALVVNSGTVNVNASETVGSLAGTGGGVDIVSGMTLTAGNADDTAFEGIISGSGGLTKDGAGTSTLSAVNSYTGATTVSAGTLEVTGTIASAVVTVNNAATLEVANGDAIANTAAVTLNNTSTLALTNSETIGSLEGASGSFVTLGANTLTTGDTTNTEFAGVISGIGGGLVKNGAGTFEVSGDNTYTGTTTVNAGVLHVTGQVAGNVTVAGGKLIIGNSDAIGGTITTTGSVISYADTVVEASAIILNSNSTQLEVLTGDSAEQSGVISQFDATDRPLEKIGAGTLTLSAANTYEGATTVTSGTLVITGSIASAVVTVDGTSTLRVDGAALLDTAAVTLNDTSTLDLTGNERIGSLAGASGSFVTLGANTLTTGDASNTSYAGVISGTGGLTKEGSGKFTLTGANTYEGLTSVNAGVLNVQDAAGLGTDDAGTTVASGAALEVQGGITIATEALTLNGGGVSSGGALRSVSGANSYDGDITLGSAARINADAGSLTVGGTVANGGFLLTVGGAGDTTFEGVISGNGGLTKDGAGTSTLSAVNTYTGATTVNAGTLEVTGTIASAVVTVNNAATLEVANGAAIANTAAVTLNNTSTLALTNSETIGSLEGASGSFVTLGANTLTTGDTNNTEFAGVISGIGGGLVKNGIGTFEVSGDNTYTGTTTVNAGVLHVTGQVAGNVTVAGGKLIIGNSDAIGGTITTTGSVISYADTVVEASAIILNSDSTQLEVLTGDSAEQSGVISQFDANDRPLEKIGAGTLTLSAANTYEGATTVTSGTLVITGSIASAVVTVDGSSTLRVDGAALLDTAAVTLNDTSTLDLTGNERIGSLAGASGSFVTLAASTLTTGDATNTSYAGVISGTGGLTKEGSGKFTLTGANTYEGLTSVNAGVLNVQDAAALGTDDAGTTVASGAALEVQGGITIATEALTLNGSGVLSGGALRSISGANSYDGDITLGSAARINADAGSLTVGGTVANGGFLLTVGGAGNTTFEDDISGSGGLTKDGTGTSTLSAVNSYTGATTVSAGKLAITGSIASAVVTVEDTATLEVDGTAIANTAAVTLNDTGKLALTGSETIGSLEGDANALVTLGANTLTTGDTNNTEFAGVISGIGGGLVKNGIGTFEVSGDNTYTGTTTVNAGVLHVTGQVAGNVTVAGGKLIIGNSDAIGGTITTTGSVISYADTVVEASAIILNSDSTQLEVLTGDAAEQSGVISQFDANDRPLEKIGAGTLTLSAANTYEGATTVTSGTLVITGSIASAVVTVNGSSTLRVDGAALLDTAAVTLNSTSTLDLTGNERIGSLAGASGSFVTLGANTLTTGDASNTSYAGVISGTGGLTKEGSGKFTLTGANTYEGLTSVNAGVLNVQDAAALGTDDAGTTVASGAALEVQGGITIATEALTLNGSGVLSGGALRSISGDNSYDGDITLAGAARINTDDDSLTVGGTVDNGGFLLTVGGAGDTTFEDVISDTGGLTKDGAGTVTLSAVNTYSGATTVSAGTLEVTGTIASAVVTVEDTATLEVTAGTISGAATVEDGGTLDVASGTFTGLLTVDAGGEATLTGTVDGAGGLHNEGSVSAEGTLSKSVENAEDGEFTLTGDLLATGGDFDNIDSATLDLAGFEYTGLDAVTNSSDATIGITLTSGALLSAATINNSSGTIRMTDAEIAGAFTNGGTLESFGLSTVTGSMVNTGTITMEDGSTGDVLTITGLVSGTGTYALDFDLSNGDTDLFVASGGGAGATGGVQLDFNPLNAGTAVLLDPNGVVVFEGVDAGATIAQTGLPTGGAILYGVGIDGTNIEVTSTINPAVAGVAAGAAVTQSLIGTVVNRPTSPFVSGLALEESCSSGGYLRATAGQATVTGNSTNNSISKTSTVDTRFSGVQGGFDVGCYDGRFFNGWDGAVGVMLGYNNGSTSQGVYSDAIDNTILTGVSGSEFNQSYGGLYLAGSKDRISGDVQLRFDHTQFDLSETAIGSYLPIGLDGLSYATDSTTFGTRMNYRFDVNEDKGINFVPTVGFNYTSTSGALLTLKDNNGTLEITPFNTVVGFVGGTLTKTKIGEDGQSATTTFLSGNYYKDFGGDRLAIFDNAALDPTDITLGSLGGFAEASIGVNYVKVLENGPSGAKQLNANIRADARFGDDVSDSYSLTAQVRLSF